MSQGLPILIRPMEGRDIERVMELDSLCFPAPWSEDTYRREMKRGQATYYIVAERDGEVIGYTGSWILGDELHITTIGVHPDCRRQKVAEQMLIHVIEEAIRRGVNIVTLEYGVSNAAAERLYLKYGFKQEGLRRGYYEITGEDAVIATLHDLQSAEFQGKFTNLKRQLQETTGSQSPKLLK